MDPVLAAPTTARIDTRRWRWLPAVNSWRYHLLLGAIGMLVLGPLGGVTASYMNFSLGFFVGGQVLAGILGSTVTYGYGTEGKHGANYIQTTAASVAGMSAMAVVIQAMVWMGMPQPPMSHLVLYLLCIGMYGAGVGMLYTPILVDRLNLVFPSGLAVANILRALTDPELLRRSVTTLGGGIVTGLAAGLGTARIEWLGATGLSMSTIGAGMVVGARVGVPALIGGLVSWALVPYFVSIGWLHQGEPFRKVTFLIALGMLLGASVIDLALIFWGVVQRARRVAVERQEAVEPWKRTQLGRLVLWVLCWGMGTVWVGTQLMGQPPGYLIFALCLVFVFALINGISQGLTDWNPISSAFVVTVLLMASLGLKDPIIGLVAGTALLVAISVGSDMQQDRSTGRRLGTSRVFQFRYQVAGIVVGAFSAVAFAKLFMAAYPILTQDQTVMSASEQPIRWSSAMTYKFVGALRSLTAPQAFQRTAVLVGIGLGFVTELLRKLIAVNPRYRVFAQRGGGAARLLDFTLFAVVLPSPYASSFGGFVNLSTSAWFAAGSMLGDTADWQLKRRGVGKASALPPDMSLVSLVGGGLIAGDALAALGIGLYGLIGALTGA